MRWRLLWAAPFFGLAAVIGFSNLPTDRAWPVAALLLIGIVVVAVPKTTWKEMLASIENAQFGPIGIGLRRDVGKAARFVPAVDKRDGRHGKGAGEAQTMFDLRMILEWKLADVAKHLLADGDKATFLTIGSLNFDGYLSDAEAHTATGILTTREEELQELPAPDRERFLKDAQTFVDGMRASIFWVQVKKRLRGEAGGANLLRDDLSSKGNRGDLLAKVGDRAYRVAPAHALSERSKTLEQAVSRMKIEEIPPLPPDHKLVVIPDYSPNAERDGGDGVPRVVRLGNLRSVLESSSAPEPAS